MKINSTMKSTEVELPVNTRSGSIEASSSSIYKSSRKNLGLYFMESDEGKRTPFAGGYTPEVGGGTTPVNIHHKPISQQRLTKTGGWTAALFIFGTYT